MMRQLLYISITFENSRPSVALLHVLHLVSNVEFTNTSHVQNSEEYIQTQIVKKKKSLGPKMFLGREIDSAACFQSIL